MSQATYSASFRIMGRDLDPGKVSRRLNLGSDDSHSAGDPRLSKSGRRYSDFSEGLWSLKSTLDERLSPDDHAAGLLARLQGRDEELRKLRELGYRMDLFLGVFGAGEGNHGFSLASETMKALGDLGVKLEVDVYD